MSTKKVEVDPALSAATKAKDAAIKARARANHSTAVIHVSAQALAAAQAAAAEHHIEAEKAEAEAARHADLARKALEDSLGLASHDAKVSRSHSDESSHKAPPVEENKTEV